MIKIFIFALSVFLAGCSTLEQTATGPIGHPMTWKARSAQLEQVQSWTAIGSVSIQHAEKTDMASLQWDQQNERYRFALFGPLGFGSVEIQGQPGRITLTQSNKPPLLAATPELLMQHQLGWQIPIVQLYYWARGLPAPGLPAKTTFDAYNHLIKLEQAQWIIEYPEYMPVGEVDLPRKMQLTSKNLKIKLVTREWRVALSQ
jgi:outer membrane lipoprotein LolB